MGVWWRLAAKGGETVFDRELFAIRSVDPAVARKALLVQASIITLDSNPITFALNRGLPPSFVPLVDRFGNAAIMLEDLGPPTGQPDPTSVMDAFEVLADASWFHTNMCAARFGNSTAIYTWAGLRTDALDNSTMLAAVNSLQLLLASCPLSNELAFRLQQLVTKFS